MSGRVEARAERQALGQHPGLAGPPQDLLDAGLRRARHGLVRAVVVGDQRVGDSGDEVARGRRPSSRAPRTSASGTVRLSRSTLAANSSTRPGGHVAGGAHPGPLADAVPEDEVGADGDVGQRPGEGAPEGDDGPHPLAHGEVVAGLDGVQAEVVGEVDGVVAGRGLDARVAEGDAAAAGPEQGLGREPQVAAAPPGRAPGDDLAGQSQPVGRRVDQHHPGRAGARATAGGAASRAGGDGPPGVSAVVGSSATARRSSSAASSRAVSPAASSAASRSTRGSVAGRTVATTRPSSPPNRGRIRVP